MGARARAGVREVWLVDLAGRAVETSLRPAAEGCADHRVVTGPGTLAPEASPDRALTLADVFG